MFGIFRKKLKNQKALQRAGRVLELDNMNYTEEETKTAIGTANLGMEYIQQAVKVYNSQYDKDKHAQELKEWLERINQRINTYRIGQSGGGGSFGARLYLTDIPVDASYIDKVKNLGIGSKATRESAHGKICVSASPVWNYYKNSAGRFELRYYLWVNLATHYYNEEGNLVVRAFLFKSSKDSIYRPNPDGSLTYIGSFLGNGKFKSSEGRKPFILNEIDKGAEPIDIMPVY